VLVHSFTDFDYLADRDNGSAYPISGSGSKFEPLEQSTPKLVQM